MREKQFVEQNKEKWGRFEQFVSGESNPGPDELNELYAHITDDLSYARTYYSRRSIRVYLNSLAQKAYLNLYKNRRNIFGGLGKFWFEILPLALYRSRRELNISLGVFVLAVLIGVLSGANDPDFARAILGDEYIEMTEANIAKGDPMAVYKSSGEIDMFLAITLNNLLVAFRTFVLGAFFGIGTIVILLFNGIMLGSFQYFFAERALLQESFLTIWMHGALEISAIVIAGGAGLTLGRGLLYPGNLPRVQSFQLGARRAVTIMLGLVPIFIAAGFIEGFFTRVTELPDLIRGSFIFLCFLFIGVYFWWFPWLRFRGKAVDLYNPEELMPELSLDINLGELRKFKEIFSGTFVIMRKLAGPGAIAALLLALIYCVTFGLIYGTEGIEKINFTKFSPYNLYQFHSYTTFFWNFFLNVGFITAVIYFSLRHFSKHFAAQLPEMQKVGPSVLIKTAVVVTIFELFILSGNALVAALGILFIPFLLFILVISTIEGLSFQSSFGRMLALLNGTRRYVFLTFFVMGLLSVLIMFIIDSPFTWFYMDVLQWNIQADEDFKTQLALLSLLFINKLGLAFVLPLLLHSQVLEYYSAAEASEAKQLSERVMQIGIKRSAYGLERE